MNIQNLFEAIEDFNFGARVGVASGFKTFCSIALSQPEPIQLKTCCQDRAGYLELCKRIVELCNRNIDENYENPWDIPLAIYLAIVEDENLDEAKMLARFVNSTDNLFWAKKVASRVLSREAEKQTEVSQVMIYLADDLSSPAASISVSHDAETLLLQVEEQAVSPGTLISYTYTIMHGKPAQVAPDPPNVENIVGVY